ncbi:MAG: RsmE family RNA methyltransferase [Gammaproteobacteria bacterium]|nr:RsmE family RNA methyltransferase [Gammaproteobacteria bacterium]
MPRIYCCSELAVGRTVVLRGSAANHVSGVLRLKAGAALVLFDGSGGEYACLLTKVGKREIEVTVNAFDASEKESPLSITLIQGVSRGERMDYTVQKAVELGVNKNYPTTE